jgi:hypothetical protein
MTDAQRAADNAANRVPNHLNDPASANAPDDTVVTNPDGTQTITHADGKVTVTDTKGNPVRSNVPGRQVAIDTAREKAFPTNPRFPGEGNPDFKG